MIIGKKLIVILASVLFFGTAHCAELGFDLVEKNGKVLATKLSGISADTSAGTDKDSRISLTVYRYYTLTDQGYKLMTDKGLVRIIALKTNPDPRGKPTHVFPKSMRLIVDKKTPLDLQVENELNECVGMLSPEMIKELVSAKQVDVEVQYSDAPTVTEKGSLKQNELGALQSHLTVLSIGPDFLNKVFSKGS